MDEWTQGREGGRGGKGASEERDGKYRHEKLENENSEDEGRRKGDKKDGKKKRDTDERYQFIWSQRFIFTLFS